MNLRHLTARTAAVGIAAVMAGGALVAGATTAATAESATTTYTCSNSDFGVSYDFAMTVTQTPAKPLAWAGQAVKQGALGKLTVSATVPAEAAGLLQVAGIDGAKSKNFALALGKGKAPFPISGKFVTAGESTTWEASGTNSAFSAPAPGAVTATLPAKFTIITTSAGTEGLQLDCSLTTGQTAGTLWSATLAKQTSKTTAKSVSAKVGKTVKLPVTVKGNAGPAAGKVVVAKGKKVLGKGTLKNGKVAVNLGKKLKAGKYKLTVKYAGTPSFGASTGKATVTVKK
jgi:hypothetical protein